MTLLKLPKLSAFACITISLIAIFAISITGTVYYYSIMPRPACLRILYTHSPQMVSEVVSDFKAWYQEKHGRFIEVTLTFTDPQTAYRKAMSPETEIWWGGPLSLFERAYSSLLPYNSTYKNEINETCHTCPLMDLSHNTPRWYAASLYGLGVTYNEQALFDLAMPQTWADLLTEEYEGKVAMVDPTRSEFTSPFIMLIIQSKNWTGGWEYLVRTSVLLKTYDKDETDSVLKVASGYVPLAILPDFYAYDKMAIYQPGVSFTYLDATVLQPDPIAILNRGTYLNEAKSFVDYILTQRAQSIIGKHRLPVRQDVAPAPPRINPFAPDLPYVRNYNKTFKKSEKKSLKTIIGYGSPRCMSK